MERRLAAILAADVVGYSALMETDEEATLVTLSAYRQVIDGLVTDHRGRVFGSAGDSVIAEFASPVEAVRCAAEIQLELKQRSANLAEDRRMRFRIGVNLGDVVVEGDNLFGDGVNVAGESLHGLSRRHDVSRNLIRVWVAKLEAGTYDEDAEAADLLQEYEAKIAALERLVGRQALEIEFLKGALKSAPRPRSATTSVIAGPMVSPSPKDAD